MTLWSYCTDSISSSSGDRHLLPSGGTGSVGVGHHQDPLGRLDESINMFYGATDGVSDYFRRGSVGYYYAIEEQFYDDGDDDYDYEGVDNVPGVAMRTSKGESTQDLMALTSNTSLLTGTPGNSLSRTDDDKPPSQRRSTPLPNGAVDRATTTGWFVGISPPTELDREPAEGNDISPSANPPPTVGPGPCSECRRQITERYYLAAVGRHWHVGGCLRCTACRQALDSHKTCFVRSGGIYCRDDHDRLFTADSQGSTATSSGSSCSSLSPAEAMTLSTKSPSILPPPTRCSRCNRALSPGDLVMRPPGGVTGGTFVYHVDCFSCSACGRRLHTGQQYALVPLPSGSSGRSTSSSGTTLRDHSKMQPFIYCRDDYKRLLLDSGIRKTMAFGSRRPTDYDDDVIVGSHQPPAELVSAVNDQNVVATGCQSSTAVSAGSADVTTANVGRKTATRPRKRRSRVSGTASGDLVPSATRPEFDIFSVARPGNESVPRDPAMSLYDIDDVRCGGYQHYSSVQQQSQQLQPVARQKRLRTSFKHHQLRIMKTYFALNHNPDAKDLKQLAQKTGLGKRILQVWFQNARAKYRRSVVRQELESRSSTSNTNNSVGLPVPVVTGLPSSMMDCSGSSSSVSYRSHHQGAGVSSHPPTSSALTEANDLLRMRSQNQQNDSFCVDQIDQNTNTNSVGSSMSDFLNSSFSDDVL